MILITTIRCNSLKYKKTKEFLVVFLVFSDKNVDGFGITAFFRAQKTVWVFENTSC